MSDYLTRLIERSVGLPPQIEPRIAPIHAPSTQMLSEPVETSAAFESGPGARIETSLQDTPPGVAVNTGGAKPAVSRAENPPPRSSTPLSQSRAEFPVEKKDDRPDPIESRPKARSRQTPSASRPEAVNITGAQPPAPPPLSRATRTVSKEKNQIVVQPEVVNHVNPATAPAVSSSQPSPKEPPAIHVSRPAPPASHLETSPPTPSPNLVRTKTVLKDKNQIVIQADLSSPFKPSATPAVLLLQPSPKEPPAIHVRIGRIELRAIMPAAQVKPPPERSAPKMSLDDYLRSRNGGHR